MRKWGIRFSIAIGVLLVLLVIARATNMLQWYHASTSANLPTIGVGELFFTSNLVEPERYDFICFTTESEQMGKYIGTYRLCGLPGDKVELKAGVLYVNGASADSALHLLHYYRMHNRDYREELNVEGVDPFAWGADSMQVALDHLVVAKEKLKAVRVIDVFNGAEDAIAKRWYKPWTMDDFGPVTVPPDSYFVLGDNRVGAMDSRFIGFVKKEQVVGVVMGQ